MMLEIVRKALYNHLDVLRHPIDITVLFENGKRKFLVRQTGLEMDEEQFLVARRYIQEKELLNGI